MVGTPMSYRAMNVDPVFTFHRFSLPLRIRDRILIGRLAVLLAAVLLIPAAGCDVKPKGSSPAAGNTQSAEPVKLSAGVALPQPLPNGTAMGFSVDYVVLEDLPPSDGEIKWVIESAKESTEVDVQLDSEGNLTTFAPTMKPEDGPFQSYLAIVASDGHKLPISPTIAMRSP